MPKIGEVRLDTNALEYWLAARGTNPGQVEVVLGLGNGRLGKFLAGQTWSMSGGIYHALAAHLRVPVDALLVPADATAAAAVASGCTRRVMSDPDDDAATMAEYAGMCARAEVHWTVHRGLSSYLMHQDHFLATEAAQARGFRGPEEDAEEYVRRAAGFKTLMAASQGDRSRAVHWLVTRQAAFDGPVRPEWVDHTMGRVEALGLGEWDERLVVSMLPDPPFAALDRRVGKAVGAADWVAVHLIDERYALVQTDLQHTSACYHPGTVAGLMREVRAAVRAVDTDFFPAPGDGAVGRRAVTRRTSEYLRRKYREVSRRTTRPTR